jgi:hypothetical protein
MSTTIKVVCARCRGFTPSDINPPAGVGICATDAWKSAPGNGKPLSPWPHAPRYCDSFVEIDPA